MNTAAKAKGRYTVFLAPEMIEQLKAIAEQEECSVSLIIRRMLSRAMRGEATDGRFQDCRVKAHPPDQAG
jgi:hypothetical protein